MLAGPNNSGKTTLLQAVALWKLGLERWTAQRKSNTRRSGVVLTRSDVTAIPLREMNLLWRSRRVQTPNRKRRLVEIMVDGYSDGEAWTCGVEYSYHSPETVYVRPVGARGMTARDVRDFPPEPVKKLRVVHVPTLSGIARDEPRHDRGMQDFLVGQGRPGEILRNLLYEIAERSTTGSGDKKGKDDWTRLVEQIADLFGIQLLRPKYSASAQPHIICEYTESSRHNQRSRPLDLASAGSGTLQVMLVLAFLYARQATIILLDEPDAHQHVILQQQVYDLLRKVASERSSQLIIASHSEVILNLTHPDSVIGFTSPQPRPLTSRTELDQLREALKRVATTEILLAREVGAILYVEGESDELILREWARITGHPMSCFLSRPFIHRLGGSNLKNARDHFFAARAVCASLKGVCLLDGDSRDRPKQQRMESGLVVLHWQRYEIEN